MTKLDTQPPLVSIRYRLSFLDVDISSIPLNDIVAITCHYCVIDLKISFC